jgi:hypothetical protein
MPSTLTLVSFFRLIFRSRVTEDEIKLRSLREYLTILEARLPTLMSNLTTNQDAFLGWIDPTSNRRWNRIRVATENLRRQFNMLKRPLIDLTLGLAEARAMYDHLKGLRLMAGQGIVQRPVVMDYHSELEIERRLETISALLTECRLQRALTGDLWPVVRARVRIVENQIFRQLIAEYRAMHPHPDETGSA